MLLLVYWVPPANAMVDGRHAVHMTLSTAAMTCHPDNATTADNHPAGDPAEEGAAAADQDRDHHGGGAHRDTGSCCAVGCLSGLLPAAPSEAQRAAPRDWSRWPDKHPPRAGFASPYRPPRAETEPTPT